MTVEYIGETEPLVLTKGKTYNVISVEDGWYRIKDDTDDDYIYPPESFKVIEK